jgi:Skp family chaperone for outer membrane proteins
MKRIMAWTVPFAVAGCLVLGMLHAGSQVTSGPLKVGVVDLVKVVDGYQKKKDRETELNKSREAMAGQLKALQKKIESMSSEIDLLDKKSTEYPAKRKELLEKQEELLMRARLADREMTEKVNQYLQEVYSEILAKIEDYRAKNNFDFIIRVDTRPLNTQESIASQLDRKTFIASSKTFDVSDDVIAFLNESLAK